jgi:hypothetical protein
MGGSIYRKCSDSNDKSACIILHAVSPTWCRWATNSYLYGLNAPEHHSSANISTSAVELENRYIQLLFRQKSPIPSLHTT